MSRIGLYLNFAFLSLSLLILVLLLIEGDLSNKYVVSHISKDLPLFFRITAVWAGSSGSLLFWYWLLAFFCVLCLRKIDRMPYSQASVLVFVLAGIQLLFAFLSLFFADAQPFRIYALEMAAGRGINPLLLHWAMIIHPPILYIGYVSTAIPLALLFSAVISGHANPKLFPFLRRWIIFSWFFLGTGILLGSKWAYEELGWGGYWAWDPVENASLMPWLLLIALIHSLIVQEKRGLLRFWNFILVICIYHMSLIGTWITRSGILEGPHAFSQSSIGTPMLLSIGMSFLYFSRFLYFERYKLSPYQGRTMEAVTSKEGSLLLNNFLMLLATAIILLGVFSPLLPLDCSFSNGELECLRVEWKQAAYNRLLIPLGIFTLFLMGASPLLAWRRDALKVWKRTLRWPLWVGLISGIGFGFSYRLLFTSSFDPDVSIWGSVFISEMMAVLTVATAAFVIAGIVQEYFQGVRSRRLRFGEGTVKAFCQLLLKNKRQYGGYLVHLAIVFLCIGYAGSAFKKTAKLEFHYYKIPASSQKSPFIHYYSGDKAYIEGYEITARDLFFRPLLRPQSDSQNPIYFTISQEAHFDILRENEKKQNTVESTISDISNINRYEQVNQPKSPIAQFLKFFIGFTIDGRMRTERYFYPRIDPVSGQVLRNPQKHAVHTATSEPDIRSSWSEDIYIQLGSLSHPQGGSGRSLNHLYEAYYHLFEKDRRAYIELFPSQLLATLEIWINPLVKFIWLGSLLFFLAGLLILLPIAEKK